MHGNRILFIVARFGEAVRALDRSDLWLSPRLESTRSPIDSFDVTTVEPRSERPRSSSAGRDVKPLLRRFC